MADEILTDAEASGIYQITNLANGKRYVGSAKCFRVRWNGHRSALERGGHHSRHLQSAWKKHGQESFRFEILEYCDAAVLIEREQAALESMRPEYNVCPNAGNSLGRKLTKETRDRIRQKAVGRKMPPRPEAYRQKLSAIHKGKRKPAHVMAALQAGRAARVRSQEECASVSRALRAAYEGGLRPREKTEEHKNRISMAFAKLSEAQVREIRRLSAAGTTGRTLAAMFQTTTSTVSEILSGKRYRWVS